MLPTGKHRFWSGWTASAALTSVLFIAVLLPPLVGEEARHFIMAVFSAVCHQIPERSPFVDGVQLAVCHRCMGIYAALAAAPMGFLCLRRWDGAINRQARWFVLGAILVPGTDWLGDLVGLWSNTALIRGATGAVFGLTVGYFLCRAFVEVANSRGSDASAKDPIPREADALQGG